MNTLVEGVPPKYQSPYIVSQYALYGLMRNLAAEYSGYGIQVNSISPDMIDTKFNTYYCRNRVNLREGCYDKRRSIFKAE